MKPDWLLWYSFIYHLCGVCNAISGHGDGRRVEPELSDWGPYICNVCRLGLEHLSLCSCREHSWEERLCKDHHAFAHYSVRTMRCKSHGYARKCPIEVAAEEAEEIEA